MAKKLRPYGDILLDLEQLYDEMIDSHGVQWADILGHAYQHLVIHRADARETSIEGEHPVFSYEFKEDDET